MRYSARNPTRLSGAAGGRSSPRCRFLGDDCIDVISRFRFGRWVKIPASSTVLERGSGSPLDAVNR